jgi:hypothetical protein
MGEDAASMRKVVVSNCRNGIFMRAGDVSAREDLRSMA